MTEEEQLIRELNNEQLIRELEWLTYETENIGEKLLNISCHIKTLEMKLKKEREIENILA